MAKTGRPTRSTQQGQRWVRKNMAVDQRKLNLAKSYLGVRTETEAVDAALDLVAFQAEVFAGLDALAGTGPLRDSGRRR